MYRCRCMIFRPLRVSTYSGRSHNGSYHSRSFSRARRCWSHLEQIPQAASERIELPDNERIAGEQIDSRASEGTANRDAPEAESSCMTTHPGNMQRIELQRRRLFVRRSPCVATRRSESTWMTCGSTPVR